MNSKHVIFATLFLAVYIVNSCGLLKKTSERQKLRNAFTSLEKVKENAKKLYNIPNEDDSLHIITFDIQLVDSFTIKDNIEYRKAQILDSINLGTSRNRIKYYKHIIHILDSIENSQNEHIYDIIAYKYKYTETRKYDDKIKVSENEIKETHLVSSGSIYINTDSSPLRNFISVDDDIKNIVLNPIGNPDYYKRIDRDIIEHYDN